MDTIKQLPLPADLPEQPSRRLMLAEAAVLATTMALPRAVFANDFWAGPRSLWLVRHETKEQINAVYWAQDQLQPGFVSICQVMRDVHAQEAVQMNLTLLDILYSMQAWLSAYGIKEPIVVNSGYRTPKTNRGLWSEGAAKNSMHLYGRAADVWMPGVPASYLGKLGLYLRSGGVGFYPSKGFVHLDSGRVRTWRG